MTDTKRLREFAEKAIEATARAIADHFCEDGDDGFRACVKEHCACRKAAVAARDAYEAAMWRPIEEAPKNELVIAHFPEAREDSQVMICQFLICDDPQDRGDWYEQNENIPGPIDVDPTHFRPLPPPPKE